MQLTDTHTHLYTDAFDLDIDEVIQKAIEKGVSKFFLPNIDVSSIDHMMDLAKKYPEHCFPMMGLHPCAVKENYEQELSVIANWLERFSFCAVGEIGIDLYWDKTFVKEQEEAFRQQINMAKQHDLPFVIHCRDAFDEIFAVLDELNDAKMRGIFHCFTGSVEQAHRVLEYGGFKLGIGGVVTFKNGGLDKVLEHVNLSDIVLETDSPYLAPTPYRGKRNESKYLYHIAEKVSTIYHMPIEEIAEVTTANAREVFGF